jgi:hypothetical protein
MWQCPPAIPALGKLRQGNREFEASLGYRARHYLKKPKKEIHIPKQKPQRFNIRTKCHIKILKIPC